MKVYELIGGAKPLEFFANKDTAMKAYSAIKGSSKWLYLLELDKPNSKLVLDILNTNFDEYILNRTPIAAWSEASGEVYKRED